MQISFRSPTKSVPPAGSQSAPTQGRQHRRQHLLRWRLLQLMFFGPLLAVLWLVARQVYFNGSPGVVTFEPTTIRSAYAGRIGLPLRRQGESFRTGDELLAISSDINEARIAIITEQLALNPPPEAIINQPSLDALSRRLQYAVDNHAHLNALLASYSEVKKSGLVTPVELSRMSQAVATAAMETERVRQEIAIELERQQQQAVAGPIALRRQELTFRLSEAVALKEAMTIQAPYDGTLIEWQVDQGDMVTAGQELGLLRGTAPPSIRLFLPPKLIEFSQAGQQATVIFPNGEKVKAVVVASKQSVNKEQAEPMSSLFTPAVSLEVKLALREAELPALVLTEGLPVRVRFSLKKDSALSQTFAFVSSRLRQF